LENSWGTCPPRPPEPEVARSRGSAPSTYTFRDFVAHWVWDPLSSLWSLSHHPLTSSTPTHTNSHTL
jgi:hypothetical protein